MDRHHSNDPLRCGHPAQQGVHSWGGPCKPCRNFAIGQWETASSFCGQHLNWTAHLDLIPSRLPQRSTSSDLCTLQNHGKPDAVARIWGLPDPNLFSARSRQRRVCRRASHLDRDGDRCPGASHCLPAFAPWQASFRHPSWPVTTHQLPAPIRAMCCPTLVHRSVNTRGAYYVVTVPRQLAGSRNTAHPPGCHALGEPARGSWMGSDKRAGKGRGRISCLRTHSMHFFAVCSPSAPAPPGKTRPLMPCGRCSSPHDVA